MDPKKFEYYSENHPDALFPQKEAGEATEILYFSKAVELGRSYQAFADSFAMYDIGLFIDTNTQNALENLLVPEKAREVRDGANFKSDEFYKGVIRSLEALKHHILSQEENLDVNLGFLEEARNRE